MEPPGRSAHAAGDARHRGGPPPGTDRPCMHGGQRFGHANRHRRPHTTRRPGGAMDHDAGDDHLPHHSAEARRGHLPASVPSSVGRRRRRWSERYPERFEDLLRDGRTAARVGPARSMADGSEVPRRPSDAALHAGRQRALSRRRRARPAVRPRRVGRAVRLADRSSGSDRRPDPIGRDGVGSEEDRRHQVRLLAVEGGPAGEIHAVEWCYSPEGLLLFLNDTVEGGRVVTAEATEVSHGSPTGTSCRQSPERAPVLTCRRRSGSVRTR